MTTTLLPDDDLPQELAAFAQRIRAFAQHKLAPHARRIDEEGTFRRETARELGVEGLLGGHGWSWLQTALASEEIGAVCGNTRGFMAVQTGLVLGALERYANAAQRARWTAALTRGECIGCFGLTEADAGSDVAALACRAQQVTGGYELSGAKIWITNGGVADVGLVFATVDPARGKDGITAFLLEMPCTGLRREPMLGKELGHRGSDHARLVFERCFVPDAAVVGKVGEGFAVAMHGLHCGRLSVAAGAVGIVRAALAATLTFARSRRQFGKPIAAFQMVQERIADMTIDLQAARALVWRCARRRDEGREVPADLAIAKLFATEAASRAADQAVLLHGGRGYSSEYPVERLLRDAMGLRIYEGTSLVQKLIVARELTR